MWGLDWHGHKILELCSGYNLLDNRKHCPSANIVWRAGKQHSPIFIIWYETDNGRNITRVGVVVLPLNTNFKGDLFEQYMVAISLSYPFKPFSDEYDWTLCWNKLKVYKFRLEMVIWNNLARVYLCAPLHHNIALGYSEHSRMRLYRSSMYYKFS